ncbi:5'-nucleotidase [Seonamhaeicola aphaedonensis]|uniref:5'-nucleotidase n=2 Tax=Seonamhaeicola aphaedonensis TaxID=1461338 RepID=A0A3D9H9N1_9FLAO|nr:5'-nucleotidase [Seonamhaeicola aphaedonensis]
MRFTLLFILLNFLVFSGCKQEKMHLIKIEGQQIQITDLLTSNQNIEAFVRPYREHINKDLDSVLAYSPSTYTKDDDELNTALGNLMCSIVFSEGNPIFNKKTGKNIDAVVLNHGGIRAPISAGAITTRTAYQVMPFENKIVVAGIKGNKVIEIVDFLVKSKRAHPFLGLKILLDQEYNLIEASINGESININKTYYIATSDYLYNSGDNMLFFKPNESVVNLDYKIRNAMIDYFKKVDTINPVRDDRFIRH